MRLSTALGSLIPLLFASTVPQPARAQDDAPAPESVRVLTGAEGVLGTWRLLGDGASPDWTAVVAHASADTLDPSDWTRADATWIGLDLRAPAAATLHLLVGLHGSVEVQLDGRTLARHERWRFRDDDRLVTVPLPAGPHRLALRVGAPEEGGWRLKVRVLDAQHRAGFGTATASVSTLDAAGLARAAIQVEETHTLDAALESVSTVRVSFPAGGVDRPSTATFAGADQTFSPGAEAVHTAPMPTRGTPDHGLVLAGEPVRTGALISIDRPLLAAAASLLQRLRDGQVPEASVAPVQWRAEEMLRAVREQEPDRAWRDLLRQEARTLVRELDRGRDPFGAPRGYVRMAHVSRLDGTAQPYELFVPPAYRGRRDWPLVITLHGFKGNAGDYFRNTFGLARDWRGGETLDAHGRHGTAPTAGPMFVIAPQARGQSMYRTMGEQDVLEALADVRARFRIDPRRIYITGGSMGGTGAVFLPLRHPDLFAASAGLAGYHDQRVRQDTHHAGLTDVERFLQARRSDVDWTYNANHLPMLLVRGTRDRPLAWTRTEVERMRGLGYEVEHREPALGHNVWTETYAGGAIFKWFERHRLPTAPRQVRLRTARERTLRSHWVRIDARSASDQFSQVDAVVRDGGVHVTAEHVDGLTFDAPPTLPASFAVSIDGQTLEGPSPLSIRRRDGRWVLGRAPPTAKRAGVSGPIYDVFHERLVFVVGTSDPDHTLLNRLTAHEWAHPKGIDVSYPIVDDVDVTPEMIANATLVLVGPPWSNLLVARWREQLPVRFEWDGHRVCVGSDSHAGPQTGAVFVAPNPDYPDHAVLVVAGTEPLGTWRARFLPEILADYVVFDARVENARGQWSCGGARRDDGTPNFAEPVDCAYRAHGFFDQAWSVP